MNLCDHMPRHQRVLRPLTPLRRVAQPFVLVAPWIRIRLYSVRVEADDGSRDPPRTKAKAQTRILSTLNPALIQPSDHVDLSNRMSISIRFQAESRGKSASFEYIRRGLNPRPFPRGATGFLYYHRHPHAAPLEGSIRLRVTDDARPSSFSHGQDLCLPSGFPWQLILPQIACRSPYKNLGVQLVRENLATPAQLSQCIALFHDRLIYPSATLFRLDQEFPVAFSGTVNLTAVGEALHKIRLTGIFRVYRKGLDKILWFPWTALQSSDWSAQPEHAGRRVVHLRILKMTTPVTLSNTRTERIVNPEEGQLLSKPNAVALRGLWDQTFGAGTSLHA
ncbi:hypothetical protein DFH06DRAFT_1475811 [Mycena polygramma]|nr:hypothetical protein DFH06DRAFT_1475811 [Mycena polygramma]